METTAPVEEGTVAMATGDTASGDTEYYVEVSTRNYSNWFTINWLGFELCSNSSSIVLYSRGLRDFHLHPIRNESELLDTVCNEIS